MKTTAAAALAIAGLAALAVLDPSTSPFFPPCVFRVLTGWQCPGCGSARALHALLHGDVAAALSANPLAVATLPLISLEGVYRAGGRTSLSSRLGGRAILALAAALILFAVARNV
jgi:Protein of unknown function (DUF2752)